MSVPDVSVVIGVWNGIRELPRSLDSVLAQTGVDFEVVVVDDGSTDGSGEFLDAAAARDARVRVIHQENRGLTRALMRGCAEARGAFIARHDADDLSRPSRLARLAALLSSDESLSMVSSWSEMIGPEDELLLEVRRPLDREAAARGVLDWSEGPPGHGSVMFRRESYERVGGYRPEFYVAQDADLWMRLAEIGGVAYDPAFLYAFRVSERSISANHRELQLRLVACALECRRARQRGEPQDSILAAAASIRPMPGGPQADPSAGSYFIGRCLVLRGDRRARLYLRRAVRRRPWHVKAWFSFVQSLVSGHEDTGVSARS